MPRYKSGLPRAILAGFLFIVTISSARSDLSLTGTGYVNIYEEIRMICNLTGSDAPTESLDWFFNGYLVLESDTKWHRRLKIFKRLSRSGHYVTSEVIIDSATLTDSGEFTCRSSSGKAKSLNVYIFNSSSPSTSHPAIVPEFLSVPTSYTVHTGDTVSLRCKIHNLDPQLSPSWQRRGAKQLITDGDTVVSEDLRYRLRHRKTSLKTRWNLVISDVTESDAGVYECQMRIEGTVYALGVTLHVLETTSNDDHQSGQKKQRNVKSEEDETDAEPKEPATMTEKDYSEQDKREISHYYKQPSAIAKFLPVPTNITVHQGELAVLKCKIWNLGPKSVFWRRSNEESPVTIGETTFSPDDRFSVAKLDIDEMESQWDLHIRDVQPAHAGDYECQISAMETYTHSVTLHVLDPVTHIPELHIGGTEYVSLFGEIQLTCNATGAAAAPEDVDWFFNGNRIHESNPMWRGRLRIPKHTPVPGRSYISELYISAATMADGGNYVCRSSDRNAMGMKVHVLNDSKNRNGTRRDSGSESVMKQMDASKSSVASCLHSNAFVVAVIAYAILFQR